jgi:hypothetical protein
MTLHWRTTTVFLDTTFQNSMVDAGAKVNPSALPIAAKSEVIHGIVVSPRAVACDDAVAEDRPEIPNGRQRPRPY